MSSKNLRKLEYIIERMIPAAVDLNSVAKAEIASLRQLIAKSKSTEQKANIMMDIATIHRDMKEYDQAESVYVESMEILPNNFGARIGLLELGFIRGDWKSLVDDLYEVAPGNREICDNLVRLATENNEFEFFKSFFQLKAKKHKGEFEKLGSIYFSWADLAYTFDKNRDALKYFKLAKKNYSFVFDSSHPAVTGSLMAIVELTAELKNI